MGFFSFLKDIFPNQNKQETIQYYDGSISASSGTSFYASEKNIIKIPEFMSAIDMIANDIASASFYDSTIKYADGDTIKYNQKLTKSQWTLLLNKTPNDFQSATEFWKSNIYNLFIRGAFFFYIYRDSQGRPKEFIPIHPNSIRKVKDEDGVYGYEITFFDETKMYEKPKKATVPYGDVFSMYAFDLENISDLHFRSVYSSLLEQLGLKNQYDLTQLNQSARILAHVKVPENLNDAQKKDIKESMREFFTNAKDVKNSAVLVTDPKAEIEILDGNKTQIKASVEPAFVEMIMVKLANALHIPLPKLNIVGSGQSFYKSREGINIDYISDAIRPWLEKIVSKLNALVYPKSTTKEFVFSVDKLMEIDFATRAEYSSKMRQNGILTTNELRVLNGFPPVEGGDKIFGNGTLAELGKGGGQDNSNVPPQGGEK